MFLKTFWAFFLVFLEVDLLSALCLDKSFGTTCQYNQFTCRCINNTPCSDNSGECRYGCDPKWMGPACQYGNLAYQKTVGGSFVDKVAITDGDKNTCASGNPVMDTHLAAIDLGAEYIVDRFIIYNRHYGVRPLNNFNVYVGMNGANINGNTLCSMHMGTMPKEIVDVKCDNTLTGKYIHIELTTSVESNVCEVELFGGLNVAYKKEATQIGTYPDYTAPLAVDGAIDNFQHTNAIWHPWWRVMLGRALRIDRIRIHNRQDAYAMGSAAARRVLDGTHVILYHGSNNVFEQSLVVASETSLIIDVAIYPEKYGDRVDLTKPNEFGYIHVAEVEVYFRCPDSTFGIDCQHTCNCNDTTEVCDTIYGECSSGCRNGYTGNDCLSECPHLFFGPKCSHACNCKIQTEKCRHTDGHCPNGCSAGYTGYGCLEDCPDGFFGSGCPNECNCLNKTEVCNKSTGDCQSGCADGYLGEDCSIVCQDGNYGQECIFECNCENETEVCHHTDGHCEQGCRKGFTGKDCQQVCPVGYYGVGCADECNRCSSKDCDHVTGRCRNGCAQGYTGSWCDQKCPIGSYGVNCAEACANCNNTHCNHENGVCISGCKTGYKGTMCSEEMKVTEDSDGGMGIIIGAAIGAVVVTLVILTVVIVLLRRRKTKKRDGNNPRAMEVLYENAMDLDDKKRTSRKPRSSKSKKESRKIQPDVNTDVSIYDVPDDVSDIHIEVETTNLKTIPTPRDRDGQTYCNADIPKRSKTSVAVNDLWNYVSKMNYDAFSGEFEQLPSGMVKPYEVAKANMSKNRYRGIYAYDHTRVILSPPNTDGSDYMNANFIEGYMRSKKFIASQGATEQNIDAFWLMMWQQKCTTIVMLTNLIEEGKSKCVMYWPDEGKTTTFGTIEVILQKEEVFCNFTIRYIMAQKDDETRHIRQYHFTSWPDKGVPSYPSSLVHFHHKITSSVKSNDHPVVVHCSAGIGRTGTYIALDYLVEEGKTTGVMDMFACVQKLRDQRTNMIQTLDQYIFLHTALVEALHCKGHSMPGSEFRKLYEEINGKRGSRVLEDDFKKLEAVYFENDVNFTAGKKPENVNKNRDQSILPADSERPILSTDIQGCGDYINAVFLPGLRKKRQFIVTQTPLEHTVIDFWRMVYEQDTKVIVDLSPDPEGYQIYPGNSDLKIGPFIVNSTYKKHDENTNSIVQCLNVKYQGVHTVMLYKPQFWELNENTPQTASIPILTNFIFEMSKMGQYGHNGGIVVTCPNGATRCGLLCVAFVSLDRLRVEQEVGTGQIIKQYRSIRPQIIPNKEQLKYCYDMLMQQLDENETYSNFA